MTDVISRGPDINTRTYNRVRAFLIHTSWYSFRGQNRLARDCDVANSTIGRILRNELNPSYRLARKITDAVSQRMGVEIDIRELFSIDGAYPTSCVCDATPTCKGCFPPEAFTHYNTLKHEYRDLRPGDWCRFTSTKQLSQSLTTKK